VLEVAFRRATIEHGFRLGKQEAGMMHYEGRQYGGMIRHLFLTLIVLGFVSIHTDRLRGGKPGRDPGAGVPRAEREVQGPPTEATRDDGGGTGRPGHTLPPAPQRPGHALPQEAAA
jgi:hypothetical protein